MPDGYRVWHDNKGEYLSATQDVFNPPKTLLNIYPKWRVGDRLWVRETFAWVDQGDDSGWVYRATDPDWETTEGWRWKPSLFMPRAASRILLEITSIRAEKLNDISEEDAMAEGVESWIEERQKSRPTHYKVYYQDTPNDPAFYSSTAKCSFETLWQSINGPDSCNENPHVWAIGFKRIKP